MYLSNAIKYFKLINKCLIVNLISYIKLKAQIYLNNKNAECK